MTAPARLYAPKAHYKTCPTCNGEGELYIVDEIEAMNLEFARVVKAVVRKYPVTAGDILGPRRTSVICQARNEAAWKMRREAGMTLSQIGRYLDRDHSTIINSLKVHESRINGT